MMKHKIIYILLFCFFMAGFSTGFSFERQWEVIGEMPFPVYNGESVVINSQIYILGGFNPVTNTPTDTIYAFNPEQQVWSFTGIMKTKRAGFVADLYMDKIIIMGGTRGDSVNTREVDTWSLNGVTETIDINDTTNRMNATGGIYNDSFYLFGGFSDIITAENSIPYVLEYNLTSTRVSFSDMAIASPLLYQEQSAMNADNFYLFGGVYFGISKKISKFNVTSKIYERIYPDLQEARAGGRAVTGDSNDIYIIGGFNENQTALATTENLKISNVGYQLSQGPLLNYPRKEFMAERAGDYIYVFGGLDGDENVVPFIERLSLIQHTTGFNNYLKKIKNFDLYSNYPNPFNAGTTIQFLLGNSGDTKLEIFSLDGRLVKTLANNYLTPGMYEFQWDGTDDRQNPAASNLYLYKLTVDKSFEIKKMLLLK